MEYYKDQNSKPKVDLEWQGIINKRVIFLNGTLTLFIQFSWYSYRYKLYLFLDQRL